MEHTPAPRHRAVLKAEIRYNDGMMSTPCLIRDISETGAKLELPGEIALPDEFDLFIEKRHQVRKVAARRRSGREIGVEFVDADQQPSTEGKLMERVAKLEADFAELKGLLGKIVAALNSSK